MNLMSGSGRPVPKHGDENDTLVDKKYFGSSDDGGHGIDGARSTWMTET